MQNSAQLEITFLVEKSGEQAKSYVSFRFLKKSSRVFF